MNTLKKNNSTKMESSQALFEFATEGIIISDSTGTIIRANPSSERLFGYNTGELINQKIEVLVPKRFSHSHEKHRDGYHQNPHPRSMGRGLDLYRKKKNGDELPIEISLSHYKVEEKQFVIAFIIDISERKIADEKIKRSNAELELKVEERTKILKETMYELEASKEELSIALEKEKDLNDMKSRFVTMASHEFRTPLSTILSSAFIINKYIKTEEQTKREKHINRIVNSVTLMTDILNEFLNLGKIEEGKISVKLEDFEMEKYMQTIIQDLNQHTKNGQRIQYDHIGSKIAHLDLNLLKNIVYNLITNAIKFSPESSIIKVETFIDNTEVKLLVKDEGIGIPENDKKHMMDRFFRASNATNIQGTGLGMHIVSKYVERMNGHLHFESILNKGTTFFITFKKIF